MILGKQPEHADRSMLDDSILTFCGPESRARNQENAVDSKGDAAFFYVPGLNFCGIFPAGFSTKGTGEKRNTMPYWNMIKYKEEKNSVAAERISKAG